jgi:hypothetical protein
MRLTTNVHGKWQIKGALDINSPDINLWVEHSVTNIMAPLIKKLM